MLHDRLGAAGGDFASLVEALTVEAEHDLAEDRCSGVVEVDGRLLGTDEDSTVRSMRSSRAWVSTEMRTSSGIASCSMISRTKSKSTWLAAETDLDLLEAQLDEEVEHLALAIGCHRIDEGLVAVTQIRAQPARSLANQLVWPGAVAHIEGDPVLKGLVFAERHGSGLLQFHGSSIIHRVLNQHMKNSATSVLSDQDSSRQGRRSNL